MNRILRIWRASFTRRWHQNFDLCHTADPVGGHQGRTALLVLGLFPKASRALVVAAVTHDQGEVASGDMSFDAKKRFPDLAETLWMVEGEEIEEQGLAGYDNLQPKEFKALKLCDWLDAWLWMMRHARHLYARSDWQEQLRLCRRSAEDLGVGAEVEAMIDAEVTR